MMNIPKYFKTSLFLLMLFSFTVSFSQDKSVDLNLDFEDIDTLTKLPRGILFSGKGFKMILDSNIKQHGNFSVRIEVTTDINKDDKYNYGSCNFILPAVYEGKEITLSGYLKLENVTDFAGLWLRIDGLSDILTYNGMEFQNLKGTSDWQNWTITLPLSEKAKTIKFGGNVFGKGKIWIDNLKILIDSVDIKNANKKLFIQYKAELDTEFVNNSGLKHIGTDPKIKNNLSLLCKVWGFLKYYHPEVAKGNYNWDFELFRIVPKILNSKNISERSEILLGWLKKIGLVDSSKDSFDLKNDNIKMFPDLGWINDDKILSKEVIKELIFIKNNRALSKNYYFEITPYIGNPIFTNEQPYLAMKYDDVGYRLLTLFRYWNIIQYFFPYKYAIGEDWKVVLDEFIPKFINANDECSFKLACLEIIARINDTHAYCWQVGDTCISYFKGKYHSLAQIGFIENKAIITGFFNDSLGAMTGLKKGDILTSINGENVNDRIKKLIPYTPGSNYTVQLRNLSYSIIRSSKNFAELTFERDGKMQNNKIQMLPLDSVKQFSPSSKRDSCFKLINDSIGYVYSGLLLFKHYPEVFKALKRLKGLIIDLRCYPAQFMVYEFAKFLLPKPISFVKFTNGSLKYPGLFKFTDTLQNGEDNPDYYKGKVIILINEDTQSQAEYTVMALRNAPNSIVIGSQTAGADGNLTTFILPGNIQTAISGIGVYYPDGRETQRIGIVPDIEIKPTIKGFIEGKDEVLEKAIEIINKN